MKRIKDTFLIDLPVFKVEDGTWNQAARNHINHSHFDMDTGTLLKKYTTSNGNVGFFPECSANVDLTYHL